MFPGYHLYRVTSERNISKLGAKSTNWQFKKNKILPKIERGSLIPLGFPLCHREQLSLKVHSTEKTFYCNLLRKSNTQSSLNYCSMVLFNSLPETPPLLSPWNNVWETSAEISYCMMACHYPDLASVFTWLKICFIQSERERLPRSQILIRVVTRHLMELLRSFVTRHFAGKAVVSSWNVGCLSGYLIPGEEENG